MKETNLTGVQLEKITEELKMFKEIHTLNLAYNTARDASETLITNICDKLKGESKINHLSLSFMALGFKACCTIT